MIVLVLLIYLRHTKLAPTLLDNSSIPFAKDSIFCSIQYPSFRHNSKNYESYCNNYCCYSLVFLLLSILSLSFTMCGFAYIVVLPAYTILLILKFGILNFRYYFLYFGGGITGAGCRLRVDNGLHDWRFRGNYNWRAFIPECWFEYYFISNNYIFYHFYHYYHHFSLLNHIR